MANFKKLLAFAYDGGWTVQLSLVSGETVEGTIDSVATEFDTYQVNSDKSQAVHIDPNSVIAVRVVKSP